MITKGFLQITIDICENKKTNSNNGDKTKKERDKTIAVSGCEIIAEIAMLGFKGEMIFFSLSSYEFT
ncbi:unnamed protein product, partial [Ceratitis capitata]